MHLYFSLPLPLPFYLSLAFLFTNCINCYNRNEACTSNGQEKATSTTAHVGRNGETSGVTVEVEDVDKMSMRKRQKVETVEKKLEKKLEKISVSSIETSKVTSLSSLRTVVKAEADKHVQRQETKQVKSNRDWRHLRPPGH